MTDPQGHRPVESSAWIERMVWRTVCMILFILGLILFVWSDGLWIYLALVFGGLFPGLFLMAREQGERHIEAQRAALAPEGRHGGDLPTLRPPEGYSAETRPTLRAAAGYPAEPYPDEDEPPGYR